MAIQRKHTDGQPAVSQTAICPKGKYEIGARKSPLVHIVLAFVLCLCLIHAPTAIEAAAEPGTNRQQVAQQFRAWVDGPLWAEAQKQGLSRPAFTRALAGVTLDWNLPDLRPPGDRRKVPQVQRQAEFGSPGNYFKESRLNNLVATGRRRLAEWAPVLANIEKEFGVPRGILVAIWGRESGFGQARLGHRASRALATQAFMGRRKQFFHKELLAALRIVQDGHIPLKSMVSSWSGALGQPQFLPSAFLLYAVDFDKDGKRDIWNSVPDSLASIANYLIKHGWQRGRDWGFEANVPKTVTCALEGPDKGKPIAEWIRLGVTRVGGRPFPPAEINRTGYLLMPAGRLGPAYIATKNFYILKTYNESDLYALFIGHLKDRFGANKGFHGKWQKIGGFTRRDVQQMQERLEKMGYNVGGADGLVGFQTRTAIGDWQLRKGRHSTCFPDSGLIRLIR